MGYSVFSALLLFVTFAAALDVKQQELRTSGRSVFVRNSDIMDKGFRLAKRSLPGWLAATERHTVTRRSAEREDTCEALRGYESKLAANTHSVSAPGPVGCPLTWGPPPPPRLYTQLNTRPWLRMALHSNYQFG